MCACVCDGRAGGKFSFSIPDLWMRSVFRSFQAAASEHPSSAFISPNSRGQSAELRVIFGLSWNLSRFAVVLLFAWSTVSAVVAIPFFFFSVITLVFASLSPINRPCQRSSLWKTIFFPPLDLRVKMRVKTKPASLHAPQSTLRYY